MKNNTISHGEKSYQKSALITDIQRFSIHDGPGIRTTIFFKGCPLSCAWCHNPETISFHNQLVYSKNNCLLCGECESVCDTNAIKFKKRSLKIIREKCSLCFKCVDTCPSKAMNMAASRYTTNQLLDIIMRDNEWYTDSGGITLSGGEPLVQKAFLNEFLPVVRKLNINVIAETCGYWNYNTVSPLLDYISLIMYDIKFINRNEHLKYTGKPNKIIIDNLMRLIENDKKVLVRMPVIPGINSSNQNIIGTADLLKKLNLHEIVLLAYHSYGESKLDKIESDLKPLHIKTITFHDLDDISRIFAENGINVLKS